MHVCMYTPRAHARTHTHTRVHTPTHLFWNPAVFVIISAVLSGTAVEHFSDKPTTRKDGTRKAKSSGKLATETMNRHRQQSISWKRLVWDLSKAPSLWTSSLDPGLRKAFHKTFVQQINFANVERKTQEMKSLMSHERETAEKQWIRSLTLCITFYLTPHGHYSLTVWIHYSLKK